MKTMTRSVSIISVAACIILAGCLVVAGPCTESDLKTGDRRSAGSLAPGAEDINAVRLPRDIHIRGRLNAHGWVNWNEIVISIYHKIEMPHSGDASIVNMTGPAFDVFRSTNEESLFINIKTVRGDEGSDHEKWLIQRKVNVAPTTSDIDLGDIQWPFAASPLRVVIGPPRRLSSYGLVLVSFQAFIEDNWSAWCVLSRRPRSEAAWPNDVLIQGLWVGRFHTQVKGVDLSEMGGPAVVLADQFVGEINVCEGQTSIDIRSK